jgi:hypothetical protein
LEYNFEIHNFIIKNKTISMEAVTQQQSPQVAEKETKIKAILTTHGLSQAEFCRLIHEKTEHYCSYHNMNLIYKGKYKSSVSLVRARAFVQTLNDEFNTNYKIDDLFD